VALLRISGPAACKVAGLVFKPLKNKDFSCFPRTCIRGRIHPPEDPGTPIDEALLTFFPGPGSYTGEDVVEISIHGGTAVQGASLAALLSAGARMAEPGEFTRRAFLNGRMDLAQAEAVAGLIAADSERARKVLLRQAEGAMGRAAGRMREELLAARAALAAVLDFPEDVDDAPLAGAWSKVSRVGEEAVRLAGGASEGVGLWEGFTVVLTGPPNAGKSSLLNALLGEERAIVHPRAGTTRDPVEGTVHLDGLPVRLVDTAGVAEGPAEGEGVEAEAVGEVEAEGVRRARRWLAKADLLVVVEDASRPGGAEPGRDPGGPPRLRVLNKCDLLPAWPAQGAGEDLPVPVSALTGEGFDLLRPALRAALVGSGGGAAEGAVPVTVRQKVALQGVAQACGRLVEGARRGTPPDCLGVELDEALLRLAELTGEVASEEVLDAVFSSFCVGK